MPKPNKIQALYDYFRNNCPLISKEDILGVDYLGENATEYSINPYFNGDPVLRSYTDGGSLKQYLFYFQSTEVYTQEAVDNIKNSGFYEELEDWIKKQDEAGNLPDIPGIQGIEALSPGFMFDRSQGVAIYQIQCRFTYIE